MTAAPASDYASLYVSHSRAWKDGSRDRELALQLMFLAYMHWADPPFVTGLAEDPSAIALWHEIFRELGGVDSRDAEFLIVAGTMAETFPWALGDESRWTRTANELKRRAAELPSDPIGVETFRGRGPYGDYFVHMLFGQKRDV